MKLSKFLRLNSNRSKLSIMWLETRRHFVSTTIVTVFVLLRPLDLPADERYAPLDIGDRKQLFIDHRFIDQSEGINLQVNPPVKLPGPVLWAEKPWEAFRFAYYSVVDDREEGIYKMWYTAFDGDQWGERDMTGDAAAGSGLTKTLVCFATSRDGLHWKKPALGLVKYKGSKKNNIILDRGFDMKTMSVFKDPHASSDQRYKMIYDEPEGGYHDKRVATSADGLHWNFPNQPSLSLHVDTQHIGFWDEKINKYVVYIRVQLNEDGTHSVPFVEPIESNPSVVAPKLLRPIRAVGRLEMDDITAPWPVKNLKMILAADEYDPEESDIYTHGPYKYPYADDAYFLFPMTYQHFREDETTVGNDGLNDNQLVASRDGIHLMRYDRQPYLRRGLRGEEDGGQIMTMGNTIRKDSYLYHYYINWPWTHGGFRRQSDEERKDKSKVWGRAKLWVAKQRLDGFVSVDTSYTGGWILTPPIVFEGDRLELNIDVSAMGEARVEIQDVDGKPIPGYHLENCDRLLFNDVAHPVTWKGVSDLSSLVGQPVRLKVTMTSAKLYAFQFCN